MADRRPVWVIAQVFDEEEHERVEVRAANV